jgi:glycosyltransferase involved in cell wall biosynthesis
MTKPLFISVIIPVYNGERFLRACLDSLKNQTYQNYEIIVVDDGSTDGSKSLVKAPAKLILSPGRTGAGAARNLGARHAQGDYLLFTDADVVAPSSWIEKTVQLIQKKGIKCGGGGYAGPIEDTFIQWFAFEELAWRRHHLNGEVESLVSNNLFCQRVLFESVGGFPENYRTASSEDMEFAWKVAQTHTLWWNADNGVYHNFTRTIKDYLRQQSRFAQDAVPMLFKHTRIVKAKTHHPKTFYAEIILTSFFLISLLFFSFLPILITAALILWLNRGLLVAMHSKHRPGFLLKTICLIFLRNITILWGAFRGFLNLCIKSKF